MRLEDLTIALRPRSPWEATDLGIALVRRHAYAIWAPWVLLTLPVMFVLSCLGYLLGHVWLAALLFWWLKPLFDRIPLFVLSRAVFGAAPGVRETLQAQKDWGRSGIWPWLLWRRFHPSRALLLPVDLLEALSGFRRSERCALLSRGTGSPSVLLTVICINIEQMLGISILLLGLLFVPVEFLSDSAQAMWDTLFENPPPWAEWFGNFIAWMAISIIEPFYIGAGFGLYLNRRTQLEAWDIELAFRRMASRLAHTAALLMLVVSLALSIPAAHADDAEDAEAPQDDVELVVETPAERDIAFDAGTPTESSATVTLESVFAQQYRDDAGEFKDAVLAAYRDPDLNPKTTITTWQRRVPLENQSSNKPPYWLEVLGAIVAFLARSGLWILAAILLVLILRYHRLWLPWITDRFERAAPLDRLEVHNIAAPERLPDDLVGAVRALWQQRQARAALALFYRGAVQRLGNAMSTPLPPGATEAECVRHSKRLNDASYAQLFVRIVRCWQGAAYAERLPEAEELETLLDAWGSTRSPPA